MLAWQSRQLVGIAMFFKLGSASERKDILGELYNEVAGILEPEADALPPPSKRAAFELDDEKDNDDDKSEIHPPSKRQRA